MTIEHIASLEIEHGGEGYSIIVAGKFSAPYRYEGSTGSSEEMRDYEGFSILSYDNVPKPVVVDIKKGIYDARIEELFN